MCKRYAFQDWTTFAAGDFSVWKRRRMEKHLAGCADCRAARAVIESVWNAAQPFAAQKVNPIMHSHIQSVIAAQPIRTAPRSSVRRLPRRAVFGTLGLTAALALCASPFFISRPLPAMADVERAMLAVRTVRYHSRLSMSFERKRNVFVTFITDADRVVRFAPAASASRGVTHNLIDPAHPKDSRIESCENRFGSASYFGGMEIYDIHSNHADPGTANERKMEAVLRQNLMNIICSPTTRKDLTFDTPNHHAPKPDPDFKTSPWTISRVTVAGQALIQYEHDIDHTVLGKLEGKTRETVLTDPKTNLVVRSETHPVKDGKVLDENSSVYDQFRYNEDIPDSEFQCPMPPQAYLLVLSDLKDERTAETIAADRAAIQKLIAASDTAWSQGDFAQFAAVWDFDYLGNTYANPAERAQFVAQRSHLYWENRVAGQRGKWKSWHTAIHKIEPVSLFSGGPDAYKVETFSSMRCAGRDDLHEGEQPYFVRNTPNGWRVLDWNPFVSDLEHLHDKKK